MALPADFQFSQSGLQDYADCARRFQLRYLRRLKWPAVEAEPVLEHERRMRQGALFHRMVHQHISGVPAEVLSKSAMDEAVRGWWDSYLRSGLTGLPERRYPEISLSAPLGKYRLVAKYDLIAVEPGQRAVIVDWKTAERRPKRERLLNAMQTVVYRYVLVQAGAHLNGGKPLQPEQIAMVYWFAAHPDQPEHLPYDTAKYQSDSETLAALVAEIDARGEDSFELTPDESRCRFCTYRSLCRRGTRAGDFLLAEMELEGERELLLDFDFDQIAEIEF